MNSCIAVITYRRVGALRTFLASVAKHCPGVPVGVFEDCANFDDTAGFLMEGALPKGKDSELEADVFERPDCTAFLGRRNVGVAANSNRAIRWFERMPEADHLLLCNDDVEATGNFVADYATAHTELKIGLFCFADPSLGEEYVGPEVKVLGRTVRLSPRMTGAVMSITRDVVKRIGYYDVVFGRHGQEHCDYNNRARMAGFINLRGKPQQCIDVATVQLKMQPIPASVFGQERTTMQAYAAGVMEQVMARYQTESWYRPFRLLHPPFAGAHGGAGIPVKLLSEVGYTLLVDSEHYDSTATH